MIGHMFTAVIEFTYPAFGEDQAQAQAEAIAAEAVDQFLVTTAKVKSVRIERNVKR